MSRRYSETEKAEAVARSLVIGPTKAAEELGIPVTTLARWARTPGTYDDIREATKEEMAAAMWKTVQIGTARLAAGLQEPGHKLGDVARAVEVASRSHALLTGGATERLGVEAQMTEGDAHRIVAMWDDIIDWVSVDVRWTVFCAVRRALDRWWFATGIADHDNFAGPLPDEPLCPTCGGRINVAEVRRAFREGFPIDVTPEEP